MGICNAKVPAEASTDADNVAKDGQSMAHSKSIDLAVLDADTDRNMQMSVAELTAFAKKFGVDVSAEDCVAVLNSFDKDASGTLSLTELYAWLDKPEAEADAELNALKTKLNEVRSKAVMAETKNSAETKTAHAIDYSFVTIRPHFTILDMAKAEPIMKTFVEKTKNEAGCVFYGWTLDGDQLCCREAYVDGAAVNAHLENIGEQIGQLTAEGVAKLDKLEIHGPADQLGVVKPGTEKLGTKYFATHSGFANMTLCPASEQPYALCSIRPHFTILDMAKAEPIMKTFVEKTKNEAGCVFYGWTLDGDQLCCREAYVDGAAVNAHLENIGEQIGQLTAEGVAKLDSLEIHCPEDQVAVVKPGTEKLGTKYMKAHSGFSKYTKSTA